jgi:4-hydroxy-4-methyl-2-oxoglutarate aldolase
VADPAAAAELRGLYGGLVYDALRFDLEVAEPFVLDAAITAAPGQPIDVVAAGPVFTCGGEVVVDPSEIDDLLRIRMLKAMEPGCIQVISHGGDSQTAHYGDISGRLAAGQGAVGAVVDGYTRDARLLARDRFPTFCRGAIPVDAYGRWQLVRYQEEERLAGIDGPVAVAPGDWMFADADGVMRIRASDVDRAVEAALERSRREATVRRRLATNSPMDLYEEIGRW